MKRIAIIALLIFVGFAGWHAGGLLSTDAIGMAVGIVFGVLASLPAALLLLAASRRNAQPESPVNNRPHQQTSQGQMSGQMPIVVMAPPAYPGYGQQANSQYPQWQYPQLNGQPPAQWGYPSQPARPERAFTIIGEQAEYVDEF